MIVVSERHKQDSVKSSQVWVRLGMSGHTKPKVALGLPFLLEYLHKKIKDIDWSILFRDDSFHSFTLKILIKELCNLIGQKHFWSTTCEAWLRIFQYIRFAKENRIVRSIILFPPAYNFTKTEENYNLAHFGPLLPVLGANKNSFGKYNCLFSVSRFLMLRRISEKTGFWKKLRNGCT